jgi:ABC-2 type transport system permease protein
VTYHSLITLFSGFWIPLWFFPGWLATIANWLPFKHLFYTPLTVYVGVATGTEAYRALAAQAAWAVAGVALTAWAWRGVQRHLIIQGG